MITMQKEKVNTHFSFPMKLDMSAFVEKTLMPQQYNDNKKNKKMRKKTISENENKPNDDSTSKCSSDENSETKPDDTNSIGDPDDEDDEFAEHFEYKLIGVTVHTGTADGGHYYSFIKERSNPMSTHPDRWFLFNDAEVKQFDPSQIEAECFGGEMTSKTYDSVTEKYLDFSFEKTNSAYMLFYERCVDNKEDDQPGNHSAETKPATTDAYEQMPSCSTAQLENKTLSINSASPIKQLSDVREPSPEVDENKNSMICESDGDAMRSPTQNAEQSENSDVIAESKCDIDDKSDEQCNNNGPPSMDDKSKKGIVLRSVVEQNVLSKELEEWIWEDNRYFLQDRNIFEHTYFRYTSFRFHCYRIIY